MEDWMVDALLLLKVKLQLGQKSDWWDTYVSCDHIENMTTQKLVRLQIVRPTLEVQLAEIAARHQLRMEGA